MDWFAALDGGQREKPRLPMPNRPADPVEGNSYRRYVEMDTYYGTVVLPGLGTGKCQHGGRREEGQP